MSSDIEEDSIVHRNVFEHVASDNNAFQLHDISRDVHLSSCGDCGREHINGEHVVWTVPTNDNGAGSTRIVWEGCADCYIRRTNPNGTH